jgi:hypothetical protein
MKNTTPLHAVDDDRNPPVDVPPSDDMLVFSRVPLKIDVPLKTIRELKSAGAAFRMACAVSGLEDKQIYMTIGIDQGYFSNIKNDKATLKADKGVAFCECVGNHIYPEWLASQYGCTLAPLDYEDQLREAQQKLEAAERRIEVLMSLLEKRG